MQRIRVSPVLAYLVCGIIIGPFGIALYSDTYPWIQYLSITETTTVHILGELGIIALLFMIGLELSFERLKALRMYIFGLGSSQILVTAIIIYFIASWFGNPMQASVLLGACFSLSSTAIVMKLLEEKKLSSRPIGTICFSILLMQDLAVVPILILTSAFTGDSNTNVILELGKSLAIGLIAVLTIFGLGKKVLSPLIRSISFSTTSEWLASFIVFFILGCSALTHATGLSLALGAFIAGLLVAETEIRHEVEIVINPIKGLLLGIVFLSVGMLIDLREVLSHPWLLILAVIGIYLLKMCIIFILCMLFKIPARQSSEASIYLAQPGEFALMILGVAMSRQLLPENDVQFFLLVTVVAMIFTPFLFNLAPWLGNLGHRLFSKQAEPVLPSQIQSNNRVVIAGFGSIGQLIAKVLDNEDIPYIACDSNIGRVQHLQRQNYNVIYGDARKKELWAHLMSDSVEVVAIAIDNHEATLPIISSFRSKYPLLSVIIRSKDDAGLTTLFEESSCEVVVENLEISLLFSRYIMAKLGKEPEEINHMMEKHLNLGLTGSTG